MADIPIPQTPTIEVVQTGSKPFHLFPQEKTQKRFTPVGKTNIYDRKVLLDTNGLLPLLPIRLYAGATHMSRGNAISPYTNDGYPFPEQSAHMADTKDRDTDIDYTKAPLCLDASLHAEVLRNLKLTEQKKILPDPLLPDVKEILSRLRFQVLLPKRDTLDGEHPIYDTFVARPDETALLLGELSFRQFSPKDSPSDRWYFLVIPSDDTIIRKILGQFLMETAGTPQS